MQPSQPGASLRAIVTVPPGTGSPVSHMPGVHSPAQVRTPECFALVAFGPPAWKWAHSVVGIEPPIENVSQKSAASRPATVGPDTANVKVTGPTTQEPAGAANVSASAFAIAP